MCNQTIVKRCLAALLLFSLFGSFSAQAAVWKAQNQWSQAWEVRYQQWVAEKFTTDFFMNPNQPIYNRVAHDCADAIYFKRIAFSYQYKLPFAINNIMRRGKLITNDMRTWDRLPESQRVRHFLKYVADRVGTRSLYLDTFPVALADIKAGDLYVEPGSHSYIVTGITETGVTSILSSTTPASPKNMVRLYAYPFFIPQDKKKYARWLPTFQMAAKYKKTDAKTARL